MWHNGKFHMLTKHGRLRFIKRIGVMSDLAMLKAMVTGKVLNFVQTGCYFHDEPDWKQPDGVRLVTVYLTDVMDCLAPLMEIQDRVSDFTFNINDFKRRFNNAK